VTPSAAQADRNAAVRAAARAWKKAGAIDGAALAAVETAYPDDRQRLGPMFRVLVFLFAILAVNGASGFVWALVNAAGDVAPALLCVFGVALLALTELLVTRMRRAQGGIEAATSLVGIGYLVGFTGWMGDKSGLSFLHTVAAMLLAAAFLLAGAAWRWGYPLYAGAAMAALLGSFTALPGARLVWIALPLVAVPVLVRLSESARLPPSHRASCAAALGVALVGLYVALNLASYDQGWLEPDRFDWRFHPGVWGETARWLFIATTALLPLVYLALGLRSRRWIFLILGLGTGIASLVTLRAYVHVAPLWVELTVLGALLIAGVAVLRRYLDSGPEKERHGFTAEPLFEDLGHRRMLEAGAAVLSLSPEARPVHEEPKFTGGGGEFGGGGASSEF
jgi:MFS family permease